MGEDLKRSEYAAFLAHKTPLPLAAGVSPGPMPSHLFDYQADATAFCIQQGRAALFLDTGLGKTVCELEFARQAGAATNDTSLILTPLAVARQIEAEAARFGYIARVIREQGDVSPGINICNYDRLGKLNSHAFGAVILDESSILKSFMGATTRSLIDAFAATPFRLCATATPAPNDHAELGTHAEFLGIMARGDMLQRWFINDGSRSNAWRLKGHAWRNFWDWMASWARMAETPADLGFDASRFALPPMRVIRHRAAGDTRAPSGSLFVQNVSATNIHDIKRQTADARAEAVARVVKKEPTRWVIWADTDYESDALMRNLDDAIEVRGSHPTELKEMNLAAFASGKARIIVTKPSVAGFGLNWQHCCRMAFVGRSFSYEAWYQAVRRCWRYGQQYPVEVHIIVAEGEDQIGRVIDRKSEDHVLMKRAMADAMRRNRGQSSEQRVPYNPTHEGKLPTWLSAA